MIQLRKIEPQDLPFLYQWENDASAWTLSGQHNFLSQQDLRDYIESTTGDIFRDGQLRLIVHDGQQTVGCIDLFDLDIRNRKAAIGVYIAPAFRGKGVASKAIEELCHYGFKQLALRQLYAIIGMQNIASKRCFEKAGFYPTATLGHWTLEGDAQLYQRFH